jgi:hypothetical protein
MANSNGLDWKKIFAGIVGTVIIAAGSSLVTSIAWQAKMEVRVDRLEDDVSSVDSLEESINKLTTSVEVNHALESAQIESVCSRIERIDARCCD